MSPHNQSGDSISTVTPTAENDKNLPKYKDCNVSVSERVADLLSRMTLEEKAGQMFHDKVLMFNDANAQGAKRVMPTAENNIQDLKMSHFNLLGPVTDARETAKWYNDLQTFASTKTRLGIPITISTDPRNHFNENIGTSFNAGTLSQWTEMLGFAALRDEALMKKFGDIARREYLALGIRCALSPQIDLATEYRWARINGGFGEDADLSGRLVQALIRGFQKTTSTSVDGGPGGIGRESVSCVTKHFPGAGPQKDGEDAHFVYGKEQIYPTGQFEYHLRPFRKAIEAGTRQIMPYYSKPVGLTGECTEEVGFGFNKGIITKLLREELGYDGIVLTDWGLITDAVILGQDMPARAWGCENLSELERVVKVLDAGCDQFGGESRPELVVEAVRKGIVDESRVDRSVAKLLAEKFELGLFDNPFVDVEAAARTVGHPDFVREADASQRRSYTLLVNGHSGGDDTGVEADVLPLRLADTAGKKFYLENVDPELFKARCGGRSAAVPQIVSTPAEADIALMRLMCPYEPRPGGFESRFHAGSLEYDAEEKSRQRGIYTRVPVSIVDVHLDRPAVLSDIATHASALLVSYGSSPAAFLDVVFGLDGCGPEGRLPFDLPSSMAAVVESPSDAPYSTKDPLFQFGHGLRYRG